MTRTIGLAVLLVALAGQAMAHSGHDESGFLHPFTGVDHVLAAVGVGVWAFLLASRKTALAVLVPASFLIMMAAGAVAGFAGIKLPLAEAAILTSVFVIGGLIAGGVRLPAALATVPAELVPGLTDFRTPIVGGEACTADLVSRWAPGRSPR